MADPDEVFVLAQREVFRAVTALGPTMTGDEYLAVRDYLADTAAVRDLLATVNANRHEDKITSMMDGAMSWVYEPEGQKQSIANVWAETCASSVYETLNEREQQLLDHIFQLLYRDGPKIVAAFRYLGTMMLDEWDTNMMNVPEQVSRALKGLATKLPHVLKIEKGIRNRPHDVPTRIELIAPLERSDGTNDVDPKPLILTDDEQAALDDYVTSARKIAPARAERPGQRYRRRFRDLIRRVVRNAEIARKDARAARCVASSVKGPEELIPLPAPQVRLGDGVVTFDLGSTNERMNNEKSHRIDHPKRREKDDSLFSVENWSRYRDQITQEQMQRVKDYPDLILHGLTL